jgi:hypothetical protein
MKGATCLQVGHLFAETVGEFHSSLSSARGVDYVSNVVRDTALPNEQF